MGWAYGVVHEELGELECNRTCNYSEFNRLLGCFQVRFQDTMANGDGDDEQQQADATIDAAESRRGSFYDGGFQRDYFNDGLFLVRVTTV